MIAIGVIDVGSPKSGKLGWAILTPDAEPVTGRDLDDFVAQIGALGSSWPLAVGFEAPLFIPARAQALDVLSGRKGEGSRPWSAGAGATVTTAALGITAYTLARLRDLMPAGQSIVDWSTCPTSPGQVLFFEAFVSGAAKLISQTRTDSAHTYDALIAAEAARELLMGSTPYRSAIAETEVFNLVGAALLRTGWTTDLKVLSAPCLVVRPGFDHLSLAD